MATKDVGIVTAYGYAKSKGYTGTEEEFAQLLAGTESAQSYAVGGTGSRKGENTDNSKYYASEAEKSNQAATLSKDNANSAMTAAKNSETNSAASQSAAAASQSAAALSETNASASAKAAAESAKTAAASAGTKEFAYYVGEDNKLHLKYKKGGFSDGN